MINIFLEVLKVSCIFCVSFLIIAIMLGITSGILYKIAKWLRGLGK